MLLFPYALWLLLATAAIDRLSRYKRYALLTGTASLGMFIYDSVRIVANQLIIPYSLSMLPLIYNLPISTIILFDQLTAIISTLIILFYLIRIYNGTGDFRLGILVVLMILFISSIDLVVWLLCLVLLFVLFKDFLIDIYRRLPVLTLILLILALTITGSPNLAYFSNLYLHNLIPRTFYDLYYVLILSTFSTIALVYGGISPLRRMIYNSRGFLGLVYLSLIMVLLRVNYTFLLDSKLHLYYGLVYTITGFYTIYSIVLGKGEDYLSDGVYWNSIPLLVFWVSGPEPVSLVLLWGLLYLVILIGEEVLPNSNAFNRLSYSGVYPFPSFIAWSVLLGVLAFINPILLIIILLPFLLRSSIIIYNFKGFISSSFLYWLLSLFIGIIVVLYYGYFIVPFSNYFIEFTIYRNIVIW